MNSEKNFLPITMIKIIPRKLHGFFDYLMGALLIGSPWIFGFVGNQIATSFSIALGASTLFYSSLTDYEMGIFQVLSFKTHLRLDLVAGILLAFSPWIFQFKDQVDRPHLFLGLFEIVAVFLTKNLPATRKEESSDLFC